VIATVSPWRQPWSFCAASHEALTVSPPKGSNPVTRIVRAALDKGQANRLLRSARRRT
jgi:hypothetical protein